MKNEFLKKLYQKHQEIPRLPSTSSISKLITKILLVLFPEQSKKQFKTPDDIATSFAARENELKELLQSMEEHLPNKSEILAAEFINKLPEIYDDLVKDIDAILQGDPAAQTEYEVI